MPPLKRIVPGSLWPAGLSGRLLLLTVLFVATAQLLLFVPSLASFQQRWLEERIRDAELAALAVEAAPEQMVSEELAGELLESAGVISVAVSQEGVRVLLLAAPELVETPRLIDLRGRLRPARFAAPFRTLLRGDGKYIRVVDQPRSLDGEFVEIVVAEGRLRAGLWDFIYENLLVTLFISAVAGGLVYLSLNRFLVRPMQRITGSIERFRENPDDPEARVPLSGRRDEVGRTEAALSRMQNDLRESLHARARLAALGEAVAKINHDLRNMLTSAQIASERLAASGDPQVAQAMPRLERALDRAVTLASSVLSYGRSEEPPGRPVPVPLGPVMDAAAEDAGLTENGVIFIPENLDGLPVRADPDQLHRIAVNLLRNALEALKSVGRTEGRVIVRAERRDGVVAIRFSDDGPGLTERTRARLFQPFSASGRPGGAGLGLAISRELAQANAGDLALLDTGPHGATFELLLPSA